MDTLRHKTKVNNSYESEPSSGSSLSEHHETSEIENLHLPTMLKPNLSFAQTNVCTALLSPPSQKSPMQNITKHMSYDTPLRSLNNSPFRGFSDSPFDQMKRKMFEIHIEKPQIPTTLRHPSPGQMIFPKFFDTIVEESSCNAVDIQLSSQIANDFPCTEKPIDNIDTFKSQSSNSDLTFNGKLNNLKADTQINGLCNDELIRKDMNQGESKVFQELSSTMSTQRQLEMLLETSIVGTGLNESFVFKRYSNERSPDLFGDSEDGENVNEELVQDHTANPVLTLDNAITLQAKEVTHEEVAMHCPTESSFTKADEQTVPEPNVSQTDLQSQLLHESCRREKELLRRIRKCLAGVPPPPAFTIPQINICAEVLKRKEEILNFFVETRKDDQIMPETVSLTPKKLVTSLFKPTHTLESVRTMAWKDVRGVRQHGLSFNLNQASENNEYLGLSVIERFVGAETASSYRNSPTSVKKRSARLKFLTQSPGNRLSHLARRRAIFSSANLATTSQKTNKMGPQILIDKKKHKNRRKNTPKRKTPGSKQKVAARKTPSTSARKRLFRNDLSKPAPSRETSKRALFQSPAKQRLEQKLNVPKPPTIKREIANRVEKSKRALFSPDNFSDSSNYASFLSQTTHFDALLKRKRNPADDNDDTMGLSTQNRNKLFCGNATNLTPRALKIKSQSFCVGAPTTSSAFSSSACTLPGATAWENCLNSSQNNQCTTGAKLQRSHTDTTTTAQSNSLTENQRKKLLWAVSQALQEKKITTKHESFKKFATVLTRVVRRIFQEYYHKSNTSNSETMLRLSKKYVYNVVEGKCVDDIYIQAKAQIENNLSQSSSRISGYIGPEEYKQRTSTQLLQFSQQSLHKMGGSLQNLFAGEHSTDVLNSGSAINQACSSYGAFLTQSSTNSFQRNNSNEMLLQTKSLTKQQPILENTALQNSTSKNNLSGLALRENIDCEHRRSAQKNFTGKDQRNVSPYAGVMTTTRLGSAVKILQQTNQLSAALLTGNNAKAVRQISFES